MPRMARGKTAGAAKGNRRGSPEAIAKRVAARNLNDVLTGRKAGVPLLDGRTAKRRLRLLRELSNDELKPADVLLTVHELLRLGETLASLRKVVPVRRPRTPPPGAAEALARMAEAYEIDEAAYRFLGLPESVLIEAGIVAAASPRKKRGAR